MFFSLQAWAVAMLYTVGFYFLGEYKGWFKSINDKYDKNPTLENVFKKEMEQEQKAFKNFKYADPYFKKMGAGLDSSAEALKLKEHETLSHKIRSEEFDSIQKAAKEQVFFFFFLSKKQFG